MAKRRKSSQDAEIIKLLFLVPLLTALLISWLVSGGVTGNFNAVLFWTIFGISAVVIISCKVVFSLPSVKGWQGERKVQRRLARLARTYNGFAFHNIIVPGENENTSQIDHILLVPNGIFAIETKNYSGYIYGKENEQNWMQVLAFGKTKNKFYNPVKQNATHVRRLKAYLGCKTEPENIVVFVQGNIERIDSNCVYSLHGVRRLLREHPNRVLTDKAVSYYAEKIQALADNPIQTNREHVAEVKEKQKAVQEGFCPVCGAILVDRVSKDGKRFLGCSNYPKCKFTKKAKD